MRARDLSVLVAGACVLSIGIGLAWLRTSTAGDDAEAPRASEDHAPLRSGITEMPGLETAAEPERAAVPVPQAKEDRKPLLVAGQVVDHRGQPVGSAKVSVTDSDGGPVISSETDSDGHFEVRGSPIRVRLVASASKTGYAESKPVPFSRGETGVKVVLSGGGVVTGTVVVDPWVSLDRIEVHLAPSTEELLVRGHKWTGSTKAVRDDGGFLFELIDVPKVRLEVMFAKELVPGAAVDGIRVLENGVFYDPRLNPLDLRGRLDPLSIEVLDEAGGRVRGALVVVRGLEGGAPDRSRATEEGFARFLLPAGPYDIEVQLAGWRRARASGISVHHVVRLERGIPVRVVLDDREPLPRPPFRLVVALLVDVLEPLSEVDAMGSFDDSREATLVASSPGPHTVAWYLERGTRRYFIDESRGSNVEILGVEEEQVLRLAVPTAIRASWQSTVERIERDG